MGAVTADRAPAYPSFAAQVVPGADVVTVRLAGELDIAVEHETPAAIDAAWGLGAQAVVVDLTAVTFMDSTGVRVLLEAAARGGGLRMLAPTGGDARVTIEETGIGPLLPLVDEPERLP